jgi:hypothetical protein
MIYSGGNLGGGGDGWCYTDMVWVGKGRQHLGAVLFVFYLVGILACCWLSKSVHLHKRVNISLKIYE